MGEPTAFELRQAEVARQAAAKGYTLVTHLRFSLLDRGRQAVGEVEDLETIAALLGNAPQASGASSA